MPYPNNHFGFHCISWYNVIELNVLIFSYFHRYRDLYFWSMIVSTWGIFLNSLGCILRVLRIRPSSLNTLSIIVWMVWHGHWAVSRSVLSSSPYLPQQPRTTWDSDHDNWKLRLLVYSNNYTRRRLQHQTKPIYSCNLTILSRKSRWFSSAFRSVSSPAYSSMQSGSFSKLSTVHSRRTAARSCCELHMSAFYSSSWMWPSS